MDEHKMLDNIRAHSFVVARVAETIVLKMAQGNIEQDLPDLDTVLAGALLHDIAKTQCIKSGCNHAKLGDEICAERGYPDIGEIIRDHVILYDFAPERYRQGQFLAKEIVYYADKRVRHDAIVSLDKRLDYIIEHYGNNDIEMHRRIRANFQRCLDIEKFFFSFIDFTPDELVHHVSPRPFIKNEPPG